MNENIITLIVAAFSNSSFSVTTSSQIIKNTDITKSQYKFLKGQKNKVIDNKREDIDIREENKSGESNITKEFNAILKDIKNDIKTTKSIIVKSCGNNINLYPLINPWYGGVKTAFQPQRYIDFGLLHYLLLLNFICCY